MIRVAVYAGSSTAMTSFITFSSRLVKMHASYLDAARTLLSFVESSFATDESWRYTLFHRVFVVVGIVVLKTL